MDSLELNKKFERALEDVFEGREQTFSYGAKELLKELYRKAVGDSVVSKSKGLRISLSTGKKVGEEVPNFKTLARGDTFQNGYLKARGMYRRVIARNKDGTVFCDIHRQADGTIDRCSVTFDEDTFTSFGPYHYV